MVCKVNAVELTATTELPKVKPDIVNVTPEPPEIDPAFNVNTTDVPETMGLDAKLKIAQLRVSVGAGDVTI